jgi:hypothetical protein
MVRHGKNVAKNESDMAIVFLFPIILWASSVLFKELGWKVTNYLGVEIPYNLGFCMFLVVFSYSIYLNNILISIYFSVLWVTGFIDDRFGTKYPKGLKGHIGLFVKTKKVTTGLFKLICTVTVALVFIMVNEAIFIEHFTVFLLLILPPHIMNLFDTRPLRVWKVIAMHSMLFFPVIFQLSFFMLFSAVIITISMIYFEGTKKAMLGDNGATLLGGVISVFAIFHLSLLLQWFLICFYFFIIFVTEKISISKWIENKPFLRRIDRWGVS